jgi:ABC-type enterochelin transport system permease subunit
MFHFIILFCWISFTLRYSEFLDISDFALLGLAGLNAWYFIAKYYYHSYSLTPRAILFTVSIGGVYLILISILEYSGDLSLVIQSFAYGLVLTLNGIIAILVSVLLKLLKNRPV